MRRLSLAFVMLALLAPGAYGQGASGLSARAEPSLVTAAAHELAPVDLHVTNHEARPVVVQVSSAAPPGGSANTSRTQATILPGATEAFRFHLRAGDPGEHAFTLIARELAPGSLQASATARLRVTTPTNGTGGDVGTPALPGPWTPDDNRTRRPHRDVGIEAPTFATEHIAAANASARRPFAVDLTNPAAERQEILVWLDLPEGWHGEAKPRYVILDPGETTRVTGEAIAPRDNASGVVPLYAQGRDATTRSYVHACAGATCGTGLRALDVAPGAASRGVVEGSNTTFHLNVTNTGNASTFVRPTLRLPPGWSGSFDPNGFSLSAGATQHVRAFVGPAANATDGLGFLAFGDVEEFVMDLRALAPPAPSTPQPLQTNETSENATDDEPIAPILREDPPPPAHSETPTSNETPPPPDEGEPWRDDAAPTTPPFRPPTLAIVPAEVRLAAGGVGLARLEITNRAATPLVTDAQIHVPAGFIAEPATIHIEAAPGESTTVAFAIRASSDIEANTTHDARATLAGAEAAFRLRVDAPDVTELDALAHDGPTVATAAGPWSLVAASVGAASVAFAWGWRRRGLLVAALYTRLLPDRVLDHPTRQALVDAVRADQGATVGALQRALALSNGQVAHHLLVLERARILRSVQDGQMRRIFTVDAGRQEATLGLGERLLALLKERGPLSAAEAAADLGVSRQRLHYHVKRLAKEGALTTRNADGGLLLRARTDLEVVPAAQA